MLPIKVPRYQWGFYLRAYEQWDDGTIYAYDYQFRC